MAEIHLGNADNIYVQPVAEKDQWNNVYGDDGNDSIKLYQGTAIGGKGNDRFEKIVIADQPWRELQVAYWSAGANLNVNLAEGWADDGEGGRDTLIGITKIHGSNGANAWIQGDANDNYYWPNGGVDTYLGGAGIDGISINSWFEPVPGQPWRQPLFADINIVVSVDGRNATVTPKIGTAVLMTLTDVEYFDAQVVTDGPWTKFFFADFITPQSMAEQAIAAGGGLRWNAAQPMGTATTLSYSFVTSAPAGGVGAAGFRAFTERRDHLVDDAGAVADELHADP